MRQKMSPRWFTSARWLIAAGWISVFAAGQARADYRTAVLADKPIGYWSLDEGKGVAPNLGTLGKNGNGEYFGEEFVAIPGPNLPGMPAGGKAIQLTRPNDGAATPPEETSGVRVDTPILDGLTAFTLEGWINPTAAQNSNRSGLFGQDNAIEFGFIGANNVHFWAELPGGGDVHTNSDWTKGNGSWHHIALSGNGVTGDMDFYVDGVAQDFTQNNSQPLEDIGKDSYGVSGNPFMIGGIVFGADRQFEGGFDEVAAFDKYLTAAQIKAHYDAALKGGNPYDYNEDGSLTVVDLDLLRGAIQTGSTNTKYDVDTNGKIELNDLSQYVERKTILNTYIGDANLDKQFSSGDLVTVFAAGKYEVGGAANVTWAQGDWNADGFFNTGDLVFAFQGGGYEKGPRAGVSAVPEPGSALLLLTGTICLAVRRRRH